MEGVKIARVVEADVICNFFNVIYGVCYLSKFNLFRAMRKEELM